MSTSSWLCRFVNYLVLVAVMTACSMSGGDTLTPTNSSSATSSPSRASSVQTPGPTDAAASASREHPPTEVRYTCGGGLTFPVGALDGRRWMERRDNGAARALVSLLDSGAGMPRQGWRELARADDEVVFGHEAASDWGTSHVYVRVVRDDVEWKATSWGSCTPRGTYDNLGSATWWLPPSDRPPPPQATNFDVLVTERACASGQSSKGRIAKPVVVYSAKRIIITFAVRPREGDQECPGNPATEYRVELAEPVGDRVLLDGGTHPPRQPVPEP